MVNYNQLTGNGSYSQDLEDIRRQITFSDHDVELARKVREKAREKQEVTDEEIYYSLIN